ncbi:hypothetical protein K523DRAFT_421436 [Schizophyllum commune Tattone D]|nr:hypothetical protein K523DRAFT_421436 [Schizophyllum commune Tattone D]
MFAPALALLSGLTLASAAGLRSAFTSEYGQEQGDWLLHQATPSGLVLGGAATDQLTISAKVENGELVMTCPYQGYQAVLVAVPDSDPVAYEVQLVNSFSDLPARTIFGGWSLSDDRTGIANENFTKVVNAFGEGKGRWDLDLHSEKYDGLNTLEWVNTSYYDHGVYHGWFIVLDSANEASC